MGQRIHVAEDYSNLPPFYMISFDDKKQTRALAEAVLETHIRSCYEVPLSPVIANIFM